MTFMEMAERTRSYRRFQEDRDIPREDLLSMVGAAGLAPCASNLQRLRFSIITEPAERDTLFGSIGWAGHLKDWNGPEEGERPVAYIVIHAPEDEKSFTGIDVGIAASYIVLEAADLGAGSCMLLSFPGSQRRRLPRLRGIPPAGDRPGLPRREGYPGEELPETQYWRDREGIHHVPNTL